MRTLLFMNELESDFTIIIFQTSHVSTSEVVAFLLHSDRLQDATLND